MDREIIAARLKELRGDKKRMDVAKDLGIPVTTLQMWEDAKRVPRDVMKIKIANYYNKSVQEIFYDDVHLFI